MNIFSFFENWDETLLPSIIVYYLVLALLHKAILEGFFSNIISR